VSIWQRIALLVESKNRLMAGFFTPVYWRLIEM